MEFANDDGETLALLALTADKFIVVWKNETQDWIPLGDRIAAMLQPLSEDSQKQVLNFTRSLYKISA